MSRDRHHAVPYQRRTGPTAPHPDDPDPRPLHPWFDTYPRPVRRAFRTPWIAGRDRLPRGWVDGSVERAQDSAMQACLALALLGVERHHRAELADEVERLRPRSELLTRLQGCVGELFDQALAEAPTETIEAVREAG